ncbi:MAG: type IX secretion system plug protein domain-containing protein, partial [Flavobacteriaceae bacterium]
MLIPRNKSTVLFCFLLVIFSSKAQKIAEISTPEHIKTIEFWDSQLRNFPVIFPQERAVLEFDDLSAVEKDYYYEITHHNADWETSRLLKTEYLQGNDRLRITQYTNSSGTYTPYNHFRLALPNEQTQFKHSGNYLITVY